jgi:hypothetical protein
MVLVYDFLMGIATGVFGLFMVASALFYVGFRNRQKLAGYAMKRTMQAGQKNANSAARNRAASR